MMRNKKVTTAGNGSTAKCSKIKPEKMEKQSIKRLN